MKFEVEVWIKSNNDFTGRRMFTAKFTLLDHTGCSGFHDIPIAAMEEALRNWREMYAWDITKKVIEKAKSHA